MQDLLSDLLVALLLVGWKVHFQVFNDCFNGADLACTFFSGEFLG